MIVCGLMLVNYGCKFGVNERKHGTNLTAQNNKNDVEDESKRFFPVHTSPIYEQFLGRQLLTRKQLARVKTPDTKGFLCK
jgi:hypothetical protein